MENNNKIIDEINQSIIDYFENIATFLPPEIKVGLEETINGLIDDKFIDSGKPKWDSTVFNQGEILENTGQLVASQKVEIVQDGNKWKIELSEKFYGKFHEYGAKIRITKKSKRFFWYKWKSTGNVIWRNMAFTKKKFFIIPPRPHLELIESDKKEIFDTIKDLLALSK